LVGQWNQDRHWRGSTRRNFYNIIRQVAGVPADRWLLVDTTARVIACLLFFPRANGVPNHNDLDGGSFVFEAGGQRWAIDMSSDDYGLENYFTQSLKWRYGYYRKSTAGQ